MFQRTLSLALGISVALVGSQLPEFTQQYAQRLGGAVDELNRVVQRFDSDSAATGESRIGALTRLADSSDALTRREGDAMEANIARLDTLRAQEAQMASAGSFGRIQAFLLNPDPDLAAATWNAYEPAVPTTGAGVATGGAGFLFGGGLVALLGRAFRRRPRREVSYR